MCVKFVFLTSAPSPRSVSLQPSVGFASRSPLAVEGGDRGGKPFKLETNYFVHIILSRIFRSYFLGFRSYFLALFAAPIMKLTSVLDAHYVEIGICSLCAFKELKNVIIVLIGVYSKIC